MKKIIHFLSIFILIGTSQLSAQSGPGGVGNSSNLILWLNADSIAGSNGNPVNIWRDLSSQNNDAIQSTSAAQPILRTNSTNGHSVVEFDGSNDFLQLTNHITTDAASIYLVLNNAVTPIVSSVALSTQKHDFFSKFIGGSADLKTGLQYVSSRYQVKDNVAAKLEMVSGSAKEINSIVRTSRRGKDRVWDPAPPAFNNNSASSLGALFDGTTASNFHNGNIAEVIMFNDTLNPVQRLILMNVISAKYGSDMELSDHYLYQNNFSHDLIAVGQLQGYSQTTARGKGVIEISNPNDLQDNEFLFTGHDNGSIDTVSETPAGFESRLERIWRVDLTGDPGTVDIKFYVDANSTSNLALTHVLIDDDGNFGNGGTKLYDYGRSVDPNGGFVSFLDVPLTEADYFTLGTYDSDNMIKSVQSGDWSVPSTWDCNCVPTATSIVLIMNTDVVSITGEDSTNSVTITENATLNLEPFSIFHLYDTLNINGTLNIDQSLITVEGAKNVTFYNNRADALSNPTTFYSLEINNSSGLVLNNALWAVENSLKVTKGKLFNTGKLTFLSGPTLTAQILESVPNSFAGGGEYVMQRYISSRKAEFVNIASPTTTTIADWDQEMYMSGVGGNDGNAQYGPGGTVYQSVFTYDNVNQNYVTVTSTSHQVQPGQGYELFLGDNLIEYTPMELGTIDVNGVPTTGNVSVQVNVGDNLLGNPYQAFINWATVSKPTSMNSTYYVFDANSGNYVSRTSPVPPGQAFWVDGPIGGLRTVTFAEKDKVYNNSAVTSVFYRQKHSNLDSLVLTLANDKNPYHHQHVIEIDPNFGADYHNYRTYRKSPLKGVPALFTTEYVEFYESERNLMVTPVAADESVQSVPINFTAGMDADYILRFENKNEVYTCFQLEDKIAGRTIDLNSNPEYNFFSDEGTFDRFTLYFGKTNADCNAALEQKKIHNFALSKSDGRYYLEYDLKNSSEIVNIRILDVLGRLAVPTDQHSLSNRGRIRINSDNLAGIYLIQVEGKNGNAFAEKVYF